MKENPFFSRAFIYFFVVVLNLINKLNFVFVVVFSLKLSYWITYRFAGNFAMRDTLAITQFFIRTSLSVSHFRSISFTEWIRLIKIFIFFSLNLFIYTIFLTFKWKVAINCYFYFRPMIAMSLSLSMSFTSIFQSPAYLSFYWFSFCFYFSIFFIVSKWISILNII